jgi:2'-5' RNA ligase
MSQTIRTFVAVPIPGSVRERIGAFTAPLRRLDADIKWVQSESLHFTLKFLGDVDPGRIGEIGDAAGAVVSGFPAFVLALGGTGCFPNPKRPSVLWIGAMDGAAALAGLAGSVEAALEALGFEREKRPFSAHLTIGRVRSPRGVARTLEAMAGSGFAAGPFRVDTVHVMRSDLQRTGAVHTPLQTLKLQG